MRNPVNRNKGGQKTRRQGGQGAQIDVHVGIQRKVSFLNAELNDVTEAHGDFRLRVEKFYQWTSDAKAKWLRFDVRILFYRIQVSHRSYGGTKWQNLLIEAFYGSEHLNITTSSGDEIDDDASASVA
jgi:hypothetical protein